jgi:hypothetical protein
VYYASVRFGKLNTISRIVESEIKEWARADDLSEQTQINLMMRALMQKIKQEIITETRATSQKTV